MDMELDVNYQWQTDTMDNVEKWKLIDMWSKLMPIALRHVPSMVQEVFACVACMEHWQFYLLRRELSGYDDSYPV